MSALVTLNSPKSRTYLNYAPEFSVELIPTEGQLLGIQGGTVEAASQSAYLIRLGKLAPRKYEAIFSPSSELLALGTVSCPSLIPVGVETELTVTIRPFKKSDASAFENLSVGYIGLID